MTQKSNSPVSIETQGCVTIIHFHRPVSESQHLAEIELLFQKTVEQIDQPKIVVNFAEVSFFPSTGVGLIISTRNEVTKKHGVLAIACMSELIEHMFTLTGLTKVIPIYDTIDEAVEALSQGS